MRSAAREDRGSVLLLGIGWLTACLLAIVLIVDATSAYLQRRALMSVADAAALAGAQSVDLAAYYRDGATTGTRLDPVQVGAAVRTQVARSASAGEMTLESVLTDGVTVRVRMSSPLELPFLGDRFGGRAQVEAAARLDYRPSE